MRKRWWATAEGDLFLFNINIPKQQPPYFDMITTHLGTDVKEFTGLHCPCASILFGEHVTVISQYTIRI